MLAKYGFPERTNLFVYGEDEVEPVAVRHCHVFVLFPPSNNVAFVECYDAKLSGRDPLQRSSLTKRPEISDIRRSSESPSHVRGPVGGEEPDE